MAQKQLPEQEMMEALAEAQQRRGQQALDYYRQAIATMRQRFGFDVQPIMTLAGGQVIPDIRLVPIPEWRPPAPGSPDEIEEGG